MDLGKAALGLTEFYDSVIIIATRYDGANRETEFSSAMRGNAYAAKASIDAYLDRIGYYDGGLDGDDESEEYILED